MVAQARKTNRVQGSKIVDMDGKEIEVDTLVSKYYPPVPGTTNVVIYNDQEIRVMQKGVPMPFIPWLPKVTKHYYIADGPQDSTHIYTIEVDGEVQNCTNSELAKGIAWEKFSNLSGSNGRRNTDILAHVVKLMACQVPVTYGYATIGWNKVKNSLTGIEQYKYFLEDSRGIDGTEYYVLQTPKSAVKRGLERMPVLPLPAQDVEVSNGLIEWVQTASPNGHQLLSIAKQFRSYLDDIVPCLTTFFVHSRDTGKKASGLGKTTIELFSHNLSFRTTYKDKPHASFTGTSGSVEKIIARQQSGNCLIDDLNIAPTATPKEIESIIHILESTVRTVFNNSDPRSRLTKDQTLARSSEYHVLPGITGEQLPHVLQSIERRMIIIPIAEGDILIEKYKQEEAIRAEQLLRLGHMALHALEKERNIDPDGLRHDIEQFEKEAERRLEYQVKQRLGREVTQLCRELPSIYARLITGLWALGRYTYSELVGIEWVKVMYPFVVRNLMTQINYMEGQKQAGDKGSVTTLIHLVRDEIASNKRINGQYYRLVDRKTRKEPDVRLEDGTPLESEHFGWYVADVSGPYTEKPEYVTVAYTDHNGTEYVFYPTEAFYNLLADMAQKRDEYRSLRDVDSVKEAIKSEGWIARRGSDRQAIMNIRLPGIGVKKCLELKLSLYIDDLGVTGVTGVTGSVDQPGEPAHSVTP